MIGLWKDRYEWPFYERRFFQVVYPVLESPKCICHLDAKWHIYLHWKSWDERLSIKSQKEVRTRNLYDNTRWKSTRHDTRWKIRQLITSRAISTLAILNAAESNIDKRRKGRSKTRWEFGGVFYTAQIIILLQ